MATGYDRHRRDDSKGGLSEDARRGGHILPRRPVLWGSLQLVRAVRWILHRALFGAIGNAAGRAVAFGVAVWALAHSALGASVPGASLWPYALLTALIGGAVAYRRRRTWEHRVRNAVYHDVPGHTAREPEVVWFGRFNIGRWTGTWDFGFRLPSANRDSDLYEIVEHLRERLPAAAGSSWMIDWDLRASTAHARLVRDMPDSLTRAALLRRVEAEEMEEAHAR